MQPAQTNSQPGNTTPIPDQTPYQTPSAGQQDWRELRDQERVQRRIERRTHNEVAGVPVWGVLLILLGVTALFGNLGIGAGWIFGVALGAWFVWVGWRPTQQEQPINWWLVGLGLLIGLGSVTASFAFVNQLVFPIVLIIVGLGILGEHYLSGQN